MKEEIELRERSNFPETWIWDYFETNQNGRAQFSRVLPDTITSWSLTAFGYSDQGFIRVNLILVSRTKF